MIAGDRSLRNASCQALDPYSSNTSAASCPNSVISLSLGSNSSSSCRPSKSFVYTEIQRCSTCCATGLAYRLFTCSPEVSAVNNAVLYAADFTPQTFNSTCSTLSAYTSQDLVVAMATGWLAYSNSALCLANVRISAPNERSVVAKVVTECRSEVGCDFQSSFHEPCAPNAIAGTEAVWKALGYDPQVGILKNVTWSVANTTSSGAIGAAVGKKRASKQDIKIVVGVPVAVVFSLTMIIVLACVLRRKQRARREQQEDIIGDLRLESLPHQFSYHELRKATGNFSEGSKLGQGGFGLVFKGKLLDGSMVAVKKMDMELDGHFQFKAEIMSIGSIHHFNLVKLRGFCMEGPACLLVYEYVVNGSLDKWIFKDLEWSKRYTIAVDVARGLTYLHEGCREHVLHLDIKPQNILLDENMRARISDFGLCKLAERETSQVITCIRGTPGYLAPEWLHSTKVTDRADVYSYGMVLLQLISSKRILDLQEGLSLFHRGMMNELIDNRILEPNSLGLDAAQRFVRIGLWCIQEEPTMRPSMKQVLNMLEGDMEVLDLPAPTISILDLPAPAIMDLQPRS